MSENNGHESKIIKEAALPKCPSCKEQPFNFADRRFQTASGLIVAALWCAKCGHLFSLQTIGAKEIMIPDPTSKDGRMIKLA